MRKRVILKNEDSTKYHNKKTQTFQLVHVQRYLAETHAYRQAECPRYRRHSLVYSVHILSTAKFSERFSNKQQTLLFSTKTDLIAHWQIHPCAKIMQMNEKTKTYYRNKFNLCGETPHPLP